MKNISKSKFVLLSSISAAVIILDQVIKWIISANIQQPIKLLPFFQLNYIQNTGAGFGLLQGSTILLIFLSLIIIGFLIYFYQTLENKYMQFFTAIILGGAVSNLIDRLILGYVIDFLDFIIWPAFNIADSAITIGVIGLIIYSLKKK